MPSFLPRITRAALIAGAASLCLAGTAAAKPQTTKAAPTAKPGKTSTTTTAPAPVATPLSTLLLDDMTLGSEVTPHGATYKWASKPRVNMGNNPGSWQAFVNWGQLYECSTGNPQPAARVELRDMDAWIKSKATGQWAPVAAALAPKGNWYVEDYVNNVSKVSDAFTLPDGGLSVRAGDGYNFHFWTPNGKIAINNTDIGGVIVSFRAKLVPETVSSALPAPCYVASAGADYWQYLDSSWSNFNSNGDVGIGRFKRVDSSWRLFTMSTVGNAAGQVLPQPPVASDAELR